MEKSLTARVEVLGARVASAWEGLRPSTRAAVERALATARALDAEQASELVRVADACAFVLHSEARSAEVFAQLIGRAQRRKRRWFGQSK